MGAAVHVVGLLKTPSPTEKPDQSPCSSVPRVGPRAPHPAPSPGERAGLPLPCREPTRGSALTTHTANTEGGLSVRLASPVGRTAAPRPCPFGGG